MVPAGEFTLPECEFTFEGMKFVGWSETRDGAIVEKIDVTENVTVYAIWEVQTFELTFTVVEFGAVDTSTLTVPYGSVITLVGNVLVVDGNKVTATPDGSDDEYTYSFVEWSVLDGTAVTEDLEIKAVFDQAVNKYTVKWMVDGELYHSETVDFGSLPTVPESPTKTSTDPAVEYVFKEWSGYVEGMTVESDLEFTAVFDMIINMVELTFTAADYGTVDTASLEVPYGSMITVVGNTVLVDGKKVMAIPMTSDAQYTYSFVEWSVSDGYVADADMDIKATFDRTVNKYTVKWFVEGELYHSETVDFGSLPTVPESPTKTSADPAVEYAFAGWYGYTDGMVVEEDLDFTAMFDTITNMVELTFSAGEYGSVDTASLKVPYGSKISVAGNAIVVDGKKVMAIPMTSDAQYTYSFVEWSVSDGYVADADMDIKATFDRTVNKYTVKWFVEGELYHSETVDFGSLPTVPESPTKTSADPAVEYAFAGWYGYTDGMVVEEDLDFTAMFDTITNMVELTFSAGEYGSVDTASLKVPYGSKISVAGNAIVVDGKKVMAIPMTSDAQYAYAFVSWSVSDGTVADKNLEAKAAFSQAVNQYTVTWIFEGAIIFTETLDYGKEPKVPDTPPRTVDPRYTYEFTGWDGYTPDMKIEGDETFTGGYNTTKNYSEEVQVSVRTSAEGVTVLIRANDGKIVPEGSYSVSYSITYYSAALKMYVTKTVNMDSVDLENDDEASSITKDQKLTDQPNYSKITKAWAYYKGVDGYSDRSDMIVYTPAKTA